MLLLVLLFYRHYEKLDGPRLSETWWLAIQRYRIENDGTRELWMMFFKRRDNLCDFTKILWQPTNRAIMLDLLLAVCVCISSLSCQYILKLHYIISACIGRSSRTHIVHPKTFCYLTYFCNFFLLLIYFKFTRDQYRHISIIINA